MTPSQLSTITFIALASSLAYADPGQDSWGDQHAKLHWAAAVGSGAISAHYISNPFLAYGVALLPSLAREEWKRQHGFSHYQPSRNAAMLIGTGIGVYSSRCAYTLQSLSCHWEF